MERNAIKHFEAPEEINLDEIRSIIEKRESLPENKRIDPNDFRNNEAFPINMIKGDLEEVEEKRKRILEQKSRLSKDQIDANTIANLVEVAVPEAIRNLGWLGDKVKVIRPSLYDDYFRGIDNIVQMLPEEKIEDEKDLKCMGFSIDFTISDEEAQKKAFEAMLAIARGKIPSIKYFSTDIMTKKGKRNVKIRDFQIPRIIMSCPHKILKESQDDLMNYEKNPNDDEAKDNAKDTTLRYYFIRESLSQLKFFADLAERMENNGAKKVYEDSLESFEKIIDEEGLDDKTLGEKVGKTSGLIGAFDLDANDGQLIKILKEMTK